MARLAAAKANGSAIALPAAAWHGVLAFLAPLERACVRHACGAIGREALPHVPDPCVPADDASTLALAATMALVTRPAGNAHNVVHLCHPRSCGADLTCGLYGIYAPNGKPYPRWTRLLLTAVAADAHEVDPRAPLPKGHFPLYATEMSTRQIVPQAESQSMPVRATSATTSATKQPSLPQKPPRGEVVAATSTAATTSSLTALFQRLALARRRRAYQQQQHQQTQQLQQRASWPLVRRDDAPGLARRAQQSLVAAWTALQREAVPPQFVLRTQRRISQSFNHKIVRAVGKDVRRSESQRRSSLTMLDALPRSTSASSCSDSSDVDAADPSSDDLSLRMSERLSLTLGRRISRDYAPMLTEGSALECRVRELVYGLLRDNASLEGHVCARFFAKQEDFTSPAPAACRYYLGRVRDTIGDLVEFIVEYRLREVGDDFLPFLGDNQVEQDTDSSTALAFAHELESAVRRAVEEYFVFSLRYEIRQWCAGAASSPDRSRFRKALARWRELPSTSREFALKTQDPELASRPLVALAIAKLRELESIATPTRKMESLLAACHALGEFIAQARTPCTNSSELLPPLSPSARVCVGDADSFLPLLIFAVSRSQLRDAFALCAGVHGLYPFASQHGERMYYLTMFEAALEFIRTYS